jgi:hypothetical protein
MSKLTRGILVCLPLTLASAAAAPARAQDELPQPKNVFSINPLGVVFEVFSGEYERAVSQQVSLALAGTHWGFTTDDDFEDEAEVSYTSADFKVRFYPNQVLRGFSIGALGGLTRLGGEFRDDCESDLPDCSNGESETVGSAGVELDWAWRMGARERFYLGVGVGAKRLFIDGDEVDSVPVGYPFLRFNVGWAF